MKAHQCFTLSKDTGVTNAEASAFGKDFAELPIVLDYLAHTNGGVFTTAARPTQTDWWDQGLRPDYWAMLLQRHPEVSEQKLRAAGRVKGKLPYPDISTYKGRFARQQIKGGPALVLMPGERSEIYQIKPNNQDGIDDGKKNLRDVERSYREQGIGGIYRRGEWYPEKSPVKLHFIAHPAFRENFEYHIDILYANDGARVTDVYIEVERLQAGLLLYKFCVEFDRPNNWNNNRDLAFAYTVVQIFIRCWAIGRTERMQQVAEAFARRLVAVDAAGAAARPPALVASGAAGTIPRISVRVLPPITEELKPLVPAIEDALYTRLHALPGEEYLLCCDESFLNSQIVEPRLRRMQATTKLLGSQRAVQYASGRTMLSILPAVGGTAAEVAKAVPEYAQEILKYAADHPSDTIIVATTVIIVVAVLALAFEAIGPIVAGEAAGEAIVGAGGRVVTTGLARSLASGTQVRVAVPETLKRVAAQGATEEAIKRQAIREAEQEVEELAAKEAGETVVKEPLKRAMVIQEPVKSGAKRALEWGGGGTALLVVGLSAKSAWASPAPEGAADKAAESPGKLVRLAVGRLFVVRRAASRPAHLPGVGPVIVAPFKGGELPPLEQPFDYAKFTDEFDALTRAALEGSSRAYYLGRLKIE